MSNTRTARARWIDGERFVASAASGHALVVDADRSANTGSSPLELVLMGLCSCSATDMVIILTRSRQAFTRIEVGAEAERAAEPPQVFTRIHLTYRVAGRALEREAVERAVRLSHDKYCSVSVMLAKTAAITHEIVIENE